MLSTWNCVNTGIYYQTKLLWRRQRNISLHELIWQNFKSTDSMPSDMSFDSFHSNGTTEALNFCDDNTTFNKVSYDPPTHFKTSKTSAVISHKPLSFFFRTLVYGPTIFLWWVWLKVRLLNGDCPVGKLLLPLNRECPNTLSFCILLRLRISIVKI